MANCTRTKFPGGWIYQYKAEDGGTVEDVTLREQLLAHCVAPPLLSLKIGSQVMLIRDIEGTLVYGLIGRVIAFMDGATFDIYLDDSNPVWNHLNTWPLVRFPVQGGETRDLLGRRERWTRELPNGVEVYRSQVPFTLACAQSP